MKPSDWGLSLPERAGGRLGEGKGKGPKGYRAHVPRLPISLPPVVPPHALTIEHANASNFDFTRPKSPPLPLPQSLRSGEFNRTVREITQGFRAAWATLEQPVAGLAKGKKIGTWVFILTRHPK